MRTPPSPLPSLPSPALAPPLILSHLLRSNHLSSAETFASAAALPLPSAAQRKHLAARAATSTLLLSGRVLDALGSAAALLGAPLGAAHPRLYFRLACQHFVELIRASRAVEALYYAREALAPLARDEPANMATLRDITVLLAYAEPAKSPAGALLALERREALAERLNDVLFEACCRAEGVPGGGLEDVLAQLREVAKVAEIELEEELGLC